MATTQNTYTGNGSTTNYSFTFPYIEQSDIKAKLDGANTTAFTLANATTLSFNTAPASGVSIIIFRDTNNDERAATFFAGSAIKAEDLNANFDQVAFVSQETENNSMNSLGATMSGQLNMSTQKIINLGTPTLIADASNKGYVDGLITTHQAQVDAAAASQTAAAASATAAATSATAGATSETNAATSATAAATSAGDANSAKVAALNSAGTAGTHSTSALNSKNAAATSETNAAASAATATTRANTATTKASEAATSAATATTKASEAATSATSAASSAASALAAFDNFDDVYLGPKASAPTTDNDGDALTGGDLYYDTNDSVMKLWTGSAWVSAYVPGDATGIINNASGNLSSTTVQNSLEELQGDIDRIDTVMDVSGGSIKFNDPSDDSENIEFNNNEIRISGSSPQLVLIEGDDVDKSFGSSAVPDYRMELVSDQFLSFVYGDQDYTWTPYRISKDDHKFKCNNHETMRLTDGTLTLVDSASTPEPEIRLLYSNDYDDTLGEDTGNDWMIKGGSNLKISKNDTTYTSNILELAQTNTQFRSGAYTFWDSPNASDYAENNRFIINPKSNSDDPDTLVLQYIKGTEYNAQPVWGVSDEGTVSQRDTLFVGRQRSDATTPVNYYNSSAKAIYLDRGLSGDTSKRCFLLKFVDDVSSDSGDLNNIALYNSLSTSTECITADSSSSHIRFGVKMNGMTQSRSSIHAGRVEGDDATPVSVYASSSTCSSYGDGSGGVTYIRGDRDPSSSHYAVYVDNDNSGSSGDNAYSGIKFKVRATDGRIYQDHGAIFSNADYAEFFEWLDGNTNNEYRGGHSVVLVGDKIRLATTEDKQEDIIGIVSVAPGVVGDSACNHWDGAYQKDQFGKEIMTPVQVYKWNPERDNWQPKTEREALNAREGCEVSKFEERIARGDISPWVRDVVYEITDYKRTKSPDWDRTKEYTPREDRPEWDAIGLVGKLWLKPGQPIGDRWKRLKVDSETGNALWLVR